METKFFSDKGIVLQQIDVIAWGPRQQAQDTYWKLRGRFAQAANGDGTGQGAAASGCSLSLVFTDPGAARELVEAIAARRSTDGFIDVDATVDPDLGRARHSEPVQAVP